MRLQRRVRYGATHVLYCKSGTGMCGTTCPVRFYARATACPVLKRVWRYQVLMVMETLSACLHDIRLHW
eukprot:2482915-Rhodomonas_salina.1